MNQEIEILNPNGDYITARIRGEFEVTIPRGGDGLLHEFAIVTVDPDKLREAVDYSTVKLLESVSYHPEGIELDGETIMAERRYEWRGHIYRIRDRVQVLDRNETISWKRVYRPRHERCYFATKDEHGNTLWKLCSDGVDFADIEPFEAIAA
jgi:hypothetical protein